MLRTGSRLAFGAGLATLIVVTSATGDDAIAAVDPLYVAARLSDVSTSTPSVNADEARFDDVGAPFISARAFDFDTPLSLALSSRGLTPQAAANADDCGSDALTCDENDGPLSLKFSSDDFSVRVGARARLSDRVSDIIGDGDRPKWYVYIAADAQAMAWAPRSDARATALTLDDMQMIGDAQAGVGTRVRGGDLAIGYVSREVSHMGAERTEDFVGLTYAWEG